MKIEVYSDFVCPFCYIGKRRLEEALKSFEYRDEIEVVFRSFELDPNAKKDTNLNIHELLAKKYGMTVEQAKQSNEQLAEQAKALGLTYNFDHMKYTNTFDAHRLFHYAKTKDKDKDLTERLFKAYFTESLHIGERDTLNKLANEVGLTDSESILSSDKFSGQVIFDETEAREFGIKGVPFFIFNRKYAISGAQPIEIFKETLQKVWKEEKPTLQVINQDSEAICTDDGCKVPNK